MHSMESSMPTVVSALLFSDLTVPKASLFDHQTNRLYAPKGTERRLVHFYLLQNVYIFLSFRLFITIKSCESLYISQWLMIIISNFLMLIHNDL
ncbi:unnamed protein product [Hymenolepis diminuta]|uniref:Uncharacterized protein n=1 Tax=Hymenolepis diminuta TaxID=6216 RepID=A0A564Z437_HYMDI|nr:unnamed protein product [Hymenolepis diminuta]